MSNKTKPAFTIELSEPKGETKKYEIDEFEGVIPKMADLLMSGALGDETNVRVVNNETGKEYITHD